MIDDTGYVVRVHIMLEVAESLDIVYAGLRWPQRVWFKRQFIPMLNRLLATEFYYSFHRLHEIVDRRWLHEGVRR